MQLQNILEWENRMDSKLRLAVLSGKGGSGKTTVATNLARVMKLPYVDLDVEEPNGFIFVKPKIVDEHQVGAFYPIVDESKCNKCGLCADKCNFNAIASTGKRLIIYDKLCHGCGVCTLVCPMDAINEGSRNIGKVHLGIDGQNVTAIQGILNVGEAMAGPVISYIKDNLINDSCVIDCAPGCSCNVVKALLDVDFGVLVAEDTQFGLHDLKLAIDLCEKMKVPYGVVINKASQSGKSLIMDYCDMKDINILGFIPFSKEAAHIYSRGNLLSDENSFKEIFVAIAKRVEGDIFESSNN